jgi:hypothetical protein
MFRAIGRVIASAILLVLTGVMVACAVYAPDFVFAFYPALSRRALAAIAAVTGVFPFAVFEVLIVLAVLWAVYTLVRVITKHHGLVRWLSGLLLGVSIGVFLFVGLWGLNHFGPTLGEKLGLDVREYSVAELNEAAQYYLAQANALAAQMPLNDDGTTAISDFSVLALRAGDGYAKLAETNELFTGSTAQVKKLASWPLFSRMGITGIFVCLTGESCVNPDTYPASLPATMCHELGHRMGCAAEDEASFCSFLACVENDSLEFQYSGYYTAFIRCYNALYKVDRDAATALWNAAADPIQADLRAANAHYSQYQGKVQDAAQAVNDAYLKAFSEELGVQSYGAVTDYLIAWYLQL